MSTRPQGLYDCEHEYVPIQVCALGSVSACLCASTRGTSFNSPPPRGGGRPSCPGSFPTLPASLGPCLQWWCDLPQVTWY